MSDTMAAVGQALLDELSMSPDEAGLLARYVLRLLLASAFGAMLGLEREWAGKIAGLRTHMLTAAGAALFVLAAGIADAAALSRVVQGVAMGIGFLGAGVILKRTEELRIIGVTSAAGIWLTAAVGITAASGRLALALVSTVLALIILSVLGWLERRFGLVKNDRDVSQSDSSRAAR